MNDNKNEKVLIREFLRNECALHLFSDDVMENLLNYNFGYFDLKMKVYYYGEIREGYGAWYESEIGSKEKVSTYLAESANTISGFAEKFYTHIEEQIDANE